MIEIIQEYWKSLLWTDDYRFIDVATTLWLLVSSVAMDGTLAVFLATGHVPSSKFTQFPTWLFTYVFRDTPLYIQLLVFYSGIYVLEAVKGMELLNALFRSGLSCTVLALTLSTCAYTTEILAGAICSVPAGEIEAAWVYGSSSVELYRCIILPSTLRIALSVYSDRVILMPHPIVLAFTAMMPSLLKIVHDINSTTYQPFVVFGITVILYLIISYVLINLSREAEKCWLRHVKPSPTYRERRVRQQIKRYRSTQALWGI